MNPFSKRNKFKVGDLVEFELSYAVVIYEVMGIKVHKNNKKYYELFGRRVVRSVDTNKFMTEARRYSPFCFYFDKNAKLADKDWFIATETVRLTLKLKKHFALIDEPQQIKEVI